MTKMHRPMKEEVVKVKDSKGKFKIRWLLCSLQGLNHIVLPLLLNRKVRFEMASRKDLRQKTNNTKTN